MLTDKREWDLSDCEQGTHLYRGEPGDISIEAQHFHLPGVSPQNENVLFCKVEMSYCSTGERPAIPLHQHGMASRPAVKASLRRKNHAALTAPGRDTGDCCDEGNGRAVQSAFIDLAE
jgi:hypothetical protein